jgi:2,3-bisphosphoglycerate-dependent phosphoglycerate mutase
MTTKNGYNPQKPFTLPEGATEVVLVRHGSSAKAVEGVKFPMIDGRGDPPLAEPVGHEQARAVAERLAEEGLSRLFHTTLTRTRQTAAPLAEATGLEPVVLPELAEVRLGEWEGGEYRLRAMKGDPTVWRAFEEERWDVIPGGETPEEIETRVRAGLDRIVTETGPDATAAAVVHGGIIGELCRLATGSRPFAFIHSDNGSISRLVVMPGGRLLLRSFNDITHLPVLTGPAG